MLFCVSCIVQYLFFMEKGNIVQNLRRSLMRPLCIIKAITMATVEQA